MTVTLPVISFAFALLSFVAHGVSWRRAFLLAAIGWGILITVSTELLSLVQCINRLSLSLFWGAVTIGTGIECYRNRGTLRIPGLQRNLIIPSIPIGIILAITFIIATVSPPNNWDSMTYHMGRVVHWMQNNSVAHYPTNILRQLYFAPWAEFAIMHLQILCGGADYCANLIQWFSLCGCIVGASLIAEQLGADRYRQIFAAVITATLPMGILQSSSTQNDLVAAFWLVCFVHFGIAFLENREIRTAIPAGFALSLAILTKGTAYLYALPYIAWFILALIRSNKRHLLHVALVTSMAIIFLNGGHYVRNTALWGNPLAMDFDHVQTTRRDLPSLLSNISRNLAVNTWTPFPVVSVLQYNIMVRVHDILGIDISDPATTLGAPFVPAPLSFHEDTAGNGLHTLLLLSALPVVFPLLRRNTTTNTLRYTVSLLGSIMLVSFLIKWQPWITRLQTPGFMLAAPLISVAMPGAQRTWIVRTAMTILVLAAVPWLVCNESRPLIGPWSILGVERNALYFANNSGLLPYYDQVTEEVAATPSCGTIEVYGNVDAYEYPFWALVRSKSKSMPRIEHSNVDNISRSISLIDFTPCMQVKLLQVP